MFGRWVGWLMYTQSDKAFQPLHTISERKQNETNQTLITIISM